MIFSSVAAILVSSDGEVCCETCWAEDDGTWACRCCCFPSRVFKLSIAAWFKTLSGTMHAPSSIASVQLLVTGALLLRPRRLVLKDASPSVARLLSTATGAVLNEVL